MWALVATTILSINICQPGTLLTPPVCTETEITPGEIYNIIEYDGVSPYTPPPNTELKQVPAGSQIGDNVGE